MTAVPSLEEFQAEVSAFLDGIAPLRQSTTATFTWGQGSDRVALLEEASPETEANDLAAARAFRAKRFDAGLAWVTGPLRHGGRELPSAYARAYQNIENRYDVPAQSFFEASLGIVAPGVYVHGSDDLKDRFLGQMYRGDLIACQLFSEPGAGSDLASVATRAELVGDEYVVNGQKVWTSGAHFSDLGALICRTDTKATRHAGISAFLIDMSSRGVEVRPLRQMNGGASFNEVFLTDVRVPADRMLGKPGGGWPVALTMLNSERAPLGDGFRSGGRGVASLTRLVELLRHYELSGDPVLRQELARVYAGFQIAKHTMRRAAAGRSGGRPAPNASVLKLQHGRNLAATADFVSHVLGPRLAADTGEWGTFAWAELLLTVPGIRIAGGTENIQRNTLAERVLGLPKEPTPA